MSDDREARLAAGDAAWKRLREALDASVAAPLGPSTEWTGHDVYAHFARWQQMTIDNLMCVLDEQPLPKAGESEDVLNERWRQQDRRLPLAMVRERCAASRSELRALLVGLSDDQWERYGEAAAEDIDGRHYEHHLAVIGR